MLRLWLMQSSGYIFKEVPRPCGLGHPRIASNLHPWAGNYRAIAVSLGADSPESTKDRNFCFNILATRGMGVVEDREATGWELSPPHRVAQTSHGTFPSLSSHPQIGASWLFPR